MGRTPSEWHWGGAVLQKLQGPSVETRQSMQASYKSCKLVRDKHGGNSLSNTSVLHMNLQTYRLQWFVTAWASLTTQTVPFKQTPGFWPFIVKNAELAPTKWKPRLYTSGWMKMSQGALPFNVAYLKSSFFESRSSALALGLSMLPSPL